MGLALGIAAIGTMVAGGVMSAQAQMQAGKDQEALAKYNARIKAEEAKQAEARGIFESQRQAEEAQRIKSNLRANIAGSGALPTEGTPLLLEAKQSTELELDNLMIGYNALTDAQRLRQGASVDRLQGKIAARSGRNAAMATYMNTGGSILGGLYSMNSMGAFSSSPSYSNSGLGNSSLYNQGVSPVTRFA